MSALKTNITKTVPPFFGNILNSYSGTHNDVVLHNADSTGSGALANFTVSSGSVRTISSIELVGQDNSGYSVGDKLYFNVPHTVPQTVQFKLESDHLKGTDSISGDANILRAVQKNAGGR